MSILLLGQDQSFPLEEFLLEAGHSVKKCSRPIDLTFFEESKFEWIISYRYHYILKPDVIKLFKRNIINLHISYLPWNRGADPNLWSFLEDTPKGVTIHFIDAGIDTGDIIVQKEIFFDESKETLSSTYSKLNGEIINLFQSNWETIQRGKINKVKQKGKGSFHNSEDKERYHDLLSEKGWDTPVMKLKGAAFKNERNAKTN